MKIKFLPYKPIPFWQEFYSENWNEAVLIGSRGGGKTHSASNLIAQALIKNNNTRVIILRNTEKSIKESIFHEIKSRLVEIEGKIELQSSGQIKESFKYIFKIQANTILNYKNSETLVFPLGLHGQLESSKSKYKGYSNIDYVILEEIEDVHDEKKIFTLLDGLRKEKLKVIIILNTPYINHWVVKRYFDYELFDTVDGTNYYKLKAKNIDSVLQVQSTYKNNPFLSERARKRYESYNDKNSYLFDLHHYYTDILGLATEFRQANRLFKLSTIQSKTKIKEKEIININNFELKIYKDFIKNRKYVIGVDPATGKGKDFTAFTVRSLDIIDNQYKLFATFKNKANAYDVANVIFDLSATLGLDNVFITAELNGYGDAVKDILERLNFPDQNIIDRRLNASNRSKIITKYASKFTNNEFDTCQDLVDEYMNIVFNDEKNRYEHLASEHDDLFLADAHTVETIEIVERNLTF